MQLATAPELSQKEAMALQKDSEFTSLFKYWLFRVRNNTARKSILASLQ